MGHKHASGLISRETYPYLFPFRASTCKPATSTEKTVHRLHSVLHESVPVTLNSAYHPPENSSMGIPTVQVRIAKWSLPLAY